MHNPLCGAGGFAELDRLAADDPSYAQAVADVVCTYLRLPFDPPLYRAEPGLVPSPKLGADLPMSQLPGFPELQVRLAAQTVLTRRLLPEMAQQTSQDDGPPVSAHGVLIDLTGATLVVISFARRRLHNVRFTYASFHEVVVFTGAAFTGAAWFKNAAFHGPVWFEKTRFQRAAIFANTKFVGWPTVRASFDEAHFNGSAVFEGAELKKPVSFTHKTFHDDARSCRDEIVSVRRSRPVASRRRH